MYAIRSYYETDARSMFREIMCRNFGQSRGFAHPGRADEADATLSARLPEVQRPGGEQACNGGSENAEQIFLAEFLGSIKDITGKALV